ncbi:TonB family protein [Thiorhodococcus drewsii AZ1]|uniref:TonB family protein n=1 Tax=Thiorhodococcus drewsii AZ1 TaxID=765913 RepID=G2E4C5_9GAMM|nr:energy transducer TonB [Thiorhodococcus drewsii]EGV29694.1 TonB family protein [Thiorhodococcus drewsii AZ1]
MSRVQNCRRCIWAGIACSAVLHAAGAAALLRFGTPADAPHRGETVVPIELGMFAAAEPAAADVPASAATPSAQPSPATAHDAATTPEPEPEPEPEPTDSSTERPETPALPPTPAAPTAAPKIQPTPAPRPLEPKTERRSTKTHHDKAPAKTAHKTTKRPPKPTPKPKARKAAPPTPAPAKTKRTLDHGASRDSGSRAQGSTGGNRNGGGQSSGASKARQQASERAYLSALQRAISRQQRYPASARRRQQTGTTTLAFVIQANGRIGQIRIVRSSGHSSIDRAAIDAMRRLGRFKPIPTELDRTTWALQVPIRFNLQ